MGIRQVPPTIKDPNLAGFLRELRAAIGGVSDQVTKIIATRSSSGGGSPGPVDPGTNPPGPTPGGDGYPPPAPLSLEAVPGAFSVTLVWTNPDIPDLQATEVWAQRSFDAWNATYEYLANAKVLVDGTVYRSRKAQSVNSTTNVVMLNKNFPPASSPEWWEATILAPTEKSYVGESAGTSWIHDGLTPGETWAYWVRNRDIENLFSTYFPNDDVGIITTTLLDPGAYLDLLTNSITATQLYSDLGKRINLIDGPDALVGSVNQRTSAVYKELDGVIDKIVDGSTDITVKTDTGYTTLQALKTSTESSSAAIVQLNTVDATSTSANVKQLLGVKGQVDSPTTGLAAAQGYIAQLNTIDFTSTSANVQELLGLRGQVNHETTGLPKAVANINAINDISVNSTSASAKKVANLDAQINTGSSSLSAQIAELNNVSVDSTSANASKLAQVSTSNATKVSVFFQNDNPPTTGRVVGDLWYDTNDANKEYRWSGSAWVVYRTATKTYSQTTAPTSTTAAPLYPGDLWIDTTTEVVNGSSVPRNKTYRWSGSSWVDVSNGSYSEAKASALVTNLEQTKIGYCTINNLATDHTTKATCESAGGVWHQGLPVATAVKQVSVTVPGVCYRNGVISSETDQGTCEAEIGGIKGVWTPGGSSALEQQFIAQQQVNGKLYSQYTVKIDSNGWVSGFGLASAQQADGSVISDFGIRADRFWIAPPTSPGDLNGLGIPLVDLGSGLCVAVDVVIGSGGNQNYIGYFRTSAASDMVAGDFFTLRDIRTDNRTDKHTVWNASHVVRGVGNYQFTDYRYGYAETRWTSSLPYLNNNATNLVVVLLAGNQTPGYNTASSAPPNDGLARLVSDKYLPFVVTTTAQYYNGVTITPGVYMNSAWIVDASITNAKIFGHICSADYNGSTDNPQTTPGTAGWCINKNGQAVFNSGIWRNYLRSKTFNGTFDSGGIITNNGTTGWAMDQNGTAVFNTVVVRNANQNISNYALVRAQGYDFSFGATVKDNALHTSSTQAYSFLHPAGTPVSLTVSFSMQVPVVTKYLAVQISYDNANWTTWYVVYDQQVSAADLEGRHLSATKTSILTVPANQYVVMRFYYRVGTAADQDIINVKLSALECYL